MSLRSSLAILVVLAGGFAAAAAQPEDPRAAAARSFLASLDETQRKEATFGYHDAERLAWNFLPNVYRGVALGDLDSAQERLLDALVAAHLSAVGQEKLRSVRWLEEVLHGIESKPDRPADHRDPSRYWVAIFGTPGEGDWSWRLQGHHLSLNFTHSEEGVCSAPFFVGANPRRASGAVTSKLAPHKVPYQILGVEEQLARELLASLSSEQLEQAHDAGPPPRDVLMLPGKNEAPPLAGIDAATFEAEQTEKLEALLERFAAHLPGEAAAAEVARLPELDGIHFRWIGSTERHEPHYWRLQGSSFVLEWCTPQGAAEHVHCLWRDLERGIGGHEK